MREQRREAAEEHDLGAVAQEQVLRQLQAPLRQSHPGSVLEEERKSELPADPEAHIVAEDRARAGRYDHQNDLEFARGARIDRRREEHRLPGERNPGALQQHDAEDQPIAVLGDEVGQGEIREERHDINEEGCGKRRDVEVNCGV